MVETTKYKLRPLELAGGKTVDRRYGSSVRRLVYTGLNVFVFESLPVLSGTGPGTRPDTRTSTTRSPGVPSLGRGKVWDAGNDSGTLRDGDDTRGVRVSTGSRRQTSRTPDLPTDV